MRDRRPAAARPLPAPDRSAEARPQGAGERTRAWYAAHAQEYVERTQALVLGAALADFLALLPPHGAQVLDTGCGSGRDARLLGAAGHAVHLIEPVEELARAAEAYTGRPVRRQLHEEMQDDARWDGIWAMATFLHLERNALPTVLAQHVRALRPGGVLYATFKEGDRQQDGADAAGRHFAYYRVEDLTALAAALAPMADLVRCKREGDDALGRAETTWLHLVLRRRAEPHAR